MRKLNQYAVYATALSFVCFCLAPAHAQKSASVKIGYFNQVLVRSSYPEAAGNEALKTQAENQLRHDVDNANKQIQQMQSEKKSQDEIQKVVRDSQIAINAKQQALGQLLQTQSAMAREKIQEAVNQVAKEKGLDLVIDAEGVFAGGKTVLDSGVDITNDIVKKLAPMSQGAVRSTATSAVGGAGAAEAATTPKRAATTPATKAPAAAKPQ